MKIIKKLLEDKILLLGIGLFFIIYFPLIFLLEVHNDESFWVEYAQLISGNWDQFHSISYDGRMYGDQKPPFQYWFGSLFVDILNNPVFSNRIATFLITLSGFVSSIFFYRKFDKTKIGNLFFLFFYLTSSIFLLFNVISIAEMYLSSIGIIFLYFLFSFYEKFFQKNKARYFYLSILFLFFVLLTKQSGYIFILLGFLIALFFIHKNYGRKMISLKIISYYLGIIFSSVFLFKIAIGFKDIGTGKNTGEVFSFSELLNITENLKIWIGNYNKFFDYIMFDNYSYGIFVVFGIFFYLLYFYRKNKNVEKFNNLLLIFLLFIGSFSSVLFIMKGPHFRHIAMFNIFFIFFISYVLSKFYQLGKKYKNLIFILLAFPFYIFGSEIFMIYEKGYSENYYKEIGDVWANGIGMSELSNTVSKLDPGILFYDPQWGLPGSYLKIMSKNNYKNLQLYPITQDFFTQSDKIIEDVNKQGGFVYIVFDTRNEKDSKNKTWRYQLEYGKYCKNNQKIYKYFKGKKLEKTYLIICKN